jgi:predicted SAM-dependent methyltransferase
MVNLPAVGNVKEAVRGAVMKQTVPMRLVQELRMEGHLAVVRVRGHVDPKYRRRRRDLQARRGVLLHFGCGSRVIPGWLNVDGWSVEGIAYVQDLRSPLFLADGSCDLIFTEHVLEHIDPQFRSRVFGELFRVLAPGGRIRIVVPDCSKYARAYCELDNQWFSEAAPTADGLAEGLNSVFVNHFHRFIDDADSLKASLTRAGFGDPEVMEHGKSRDGRLAIDTDNHHREILNLYVEATKAPAS